MEREFYIIKDENGKERKYAINSQEEKDDFFNNAKTNNKKVFDQSGNTVDLNNILQPGKQEGSSTETKTEQTQVNETSLSQNNQQQNTDSSSENTLSDSQLVLKKSPRKGSRKNQDGTESTHLMMRAFHEGQHVAFPSLFQDDNGNWIDYSKDDGYGRAYEEAKKRNELYTFDTEEEAINFADKGSWKTKQQKQKPEPILRFGATGPYYEDPITGNIIKEENLNKEQKEKVKETKDLSEDLVVADPTPIFKSEKKDDDEEKILEEKTEEQIAYEKEKEKYNREILEGFDIANFDVTDPAFWSSGTPTEQKDKLQAMGFSDDLFEMKELDNGMLRIYRKNKLPDGTFTLSDDYVDIRSNIRKSQEYKKFLTGTFKKGQVGEKFQTQKFNEAINKESENLYRFLYQNLNEEELSNIENYQNNLIEDFKLKKNKLLPQEDIDKLNLDFGAKNPQLPIDNNEFLSNGEINPNYNPANNPNLFKPITETRTRRVPQGKFDVTQQYEVVVNPYEEELKEAEKSLRKAGISNPTQEQIENFARKLIIRKEQQRIIKNNTSKLLNSKEVEGEQWIFTGRLPMPNFSNTQSFNLSEFQAISGLSDRSQAKKIIQADYEKAYYEKNNLPTIKKLSNDIISFETNVQNPDYEFSISEDDEVVTLKNDKKVPKKIYNNYLSNVAEFETSYRDYENFLDENDQAVLDVDENSSFINNLVQRNYNDSRQAIKEFALGAENLFYTGAGGLHKFTQFSGFLASGGTFNPDETTYGKLVNQRLVNLQQSMRILKEEEQVPLDFKDAFKSREGVGRWALSTFANNIAQFGAIFLGTPGVALVASSSGANQYGVMLEEEQQPGAEKKSYLKKNAIMIGYAASEFLPDILFLSQVNRVAKRMKTFKGNVLNDGVGTYSRFLKETVLDGLSLRATEAIGEGTTGLLQNGISGRAPLEDVPEQAMSGYLFGAKTSYISTLNGIIANQFSPTPTVKQFRENLDQISKIDNSIFKIKSDIIKKDFAKKGNNNPTQEQVSEKLKDPKLNNEAIEVLSEEQAKLLGENETIIDQQVSRVKNLSSEFAGTYRDLVVEKQKLKIKAQKINADKTLDKNSKKEIISNLQNKYDNVNRVINDLNNSEVFGDKFTGFKYSKKKEDVSRKEEIFKQAKSDLFTQGNTNPSDFQINERARIIYNTQEINNDFKQKRGKTKLGKSLKNFQTVQEAIDGINKIDNITDANKQELIQEIQNGAHGANVPTTDGQFIPLQVVENMAKDNRDETKTHELGHTILNEAISQDPKAFESVASDIMQYVAKTNPALYTKLQLRTEGMPADEVLTNFMEMVASGEIDFKKEENSGLGGWMAGMLNIGVKDATKSDVDFNFESETDAVNFVTQLAKKIKNGTLTLKQRREISRSKIAREAASKVEKRRSDDIKFSKDAKPAVDELGKMGWTPKTWKEQGADFAIKEMKDNKMLDGLIANKYKADKVPQDFVAKVYSELTSHVKNFNPKVNDSLFGWVNSQIANKAGNVFNREYKTKQKTVDIDATTIEGRPVIQIEADTSTDLDFIDNITLNPLQTEQNSKLRKDLGLNNDMLNKVRQAVTKTFGTRLPDINTKKFKEELQKRFRTELKKPIQDMIGSRANYDTFLNENFEAVYNVLPVETLVQMERSVKPDQRIFTESRRITKPTEVDQLISQGLLPKNTNRTSGPQLHAKKPYPGVEKVMAFYRGSNMQQELGYEVGASTLGTRKDKLAMEIGVELAFDATSEVLQDPVVQEKRKGILQLQGQEQATNELAIIAKQIDRDPNIKFSTKPNRKAQAGSKIFEDGVDLVNAISAQGDLTGIAELDGNVYVGLNQYADIPSSTIDFVVKNFYENGKISLHSGDILKKLAKLVPAGDTRSKGFEQYVINQFAKIKGVVPRFEYQSEEGVDIPDVYATLNGKDFHIEVKMFDAQVSSLTINDVNLETGEITIDKMDNLSQENQNKIKEIAKGLIPVLKDIQTETRDMASMSKEDIISLIKQSNKKLPKNQQIKIPETITKKDIDYLNNWSSPKSLMPSWAHGVLKAEGYWNKLTQRATFDQTLIEDFYLNKAVPTNYIYMLGKGLFSIGNDVLNLGVPKLEGTFTVPIRQVRASQKQTIKGVKSNTGYVNVNLRALPVADKITSKSNIDILDKSSIDALSKAGESVKMSKKADDVISLDEAFNSRINYSKTGKARGISVFDFDDTLAKTKSGIRATIPNPDGTPKPNRKVVFLAGGAGSGKGNVIKKLGLSDSGFKIVNSDISLEWLKKNSGLPADMRDLTPEQRSTLGKLGAESRKIARRKMMKYQGNANGVVVDGTGGSVKSMTNLVNEFKDKGYDVSMLFVDTSLDVALDRNRKRKERSLLDVIVKRNHESVQKNKPEFKTMFGNRFMEVNTDNLTQKDPMPDNLVSEMNDFVNSYEKVRLDAEEFATQGESILQRGGEFDFTEFNDVVDGTPGPLLDKAKQRIDKFGNKDVFVLTARPQASAGPIQQFLKSQGLYIPIDNITGLANSTGDAKAEWMLGKFAEGYNDMYFVDDAIQNVEAVKQALDQLDIKSDVVQAKIKFSKTASKELNDMIERKKGIGSKKVFSGAEARARGRDIGRFDFYIPPSAEDFKGLLYYFLGKGKQGDADMKFFSDNLLKPFANGIRAWNTYKQNMADDFRNLKKQNPKVVKKLNDKVKGTSLTNDSAIRVYLWNKAGIEIPNISKQLEKTLVDHVNNNSDLKSFADVLSTITKIKQGYTTPGQNWVVGSIARDLSDTVNKVGRKQFLNEWIDNKDQIFTPENLNKIEAAYGTRYREALENILFRMENGGNRVMSKDRDTNFIVNWINGAVGSIMFFNMRSALLQTISSVNFINFSDNNIFKASKAFANQPQFWKDFTMLFNSDQLKQRRRGLQTDVSASELTKSFKENGNTYEAVVNFLLEKGFLPTQIADSTAIAFGGASFYRNRYNKYIKDGKSPKEANEQAMLDFQEIAEETQQSSREDLVSKQQASVLGRIILAFQNVTMQYGRLTKKALSDLTNRRGDTKTNISKILYYGAVQNIVFASLQSALMFMLFSGDEEDEVIQEKETRVANTILDSFLRGTGIYGALASTLKNVAVEWHVQSQKAKEGFKRDEVMDIAQEALNLSPPIGAKVRKIVQAYKMKEFGRTATRDKLKFRLENPKLAAAAALIEGATNIPTQRLLNKANNLEEAITSDHETWKRVAMVLGWSRWELGLKDEEVEAAREEVKEEKKVEREIKKEEKKEEKRKEKEEQKKKEEEEKKKKGIKTLRCSGIRSNGTRCKITGETSKKKFLCVHHAEFKDGMDRDGDGKKEYRCTATTSSGKRCKNKTENKNKKCYAHQ